jgi:hypothetical protein
MFEQSPNGYFVNDLIVFNSLSEGGYVSKGFIFEPPDMVNAQVSELNQFQEQLSLLLSSLTEQQRLQIQYYCDSDYRSELLRYHEETQKSANLWTRRTRNERFERYWRLMTERRLRRQRLVFYLSRKIETSAKGIKSAAALTEYYNQLLGQLQSEFEHTHEMLTDIFAGQGARIIPMKDADHFRHLKIFLNPSLSERFDYDPIEGFDPQLSIQENCWHSEGAGQADFGFFMDGRYHSIIVLSRWPKMTYPGLINRLTGLRLLDYTITVNLDPLSVRKEIHKEEKEHDRIAGDYASENKLSLLTVMDKKQKKIAALMQGHTFPFKVLFAIRTWDKSKEGLIAKTTAIKNAINSMNSAQYAESTLPSTSKKLFYQTWPGWTWSKYNARKLYGENRYIADMLPVASTFTGHLDSAEAIYEGPNQNLVGIKTFSGSAGNQSPQHAVLLGMSGAGKSVTICDLLSQTENYYAYTVIIEEGLSYGIYTQTVEPEAKPIVIAAMTAGETLVTSSINEGRGGSSVIGSLSRMNDINKERNGSNRGGGGGSKQKSPKGSFPPEDPSGDGTVAEMIRKSKNPDA